MENQFANEPLEKIPDAEISYHVLANIKSTGLTHLMKLVLCAKYGGRCIDMIKEKIKENPNIINEQCAEGWTPLIIACANSNTYSSIEIVKLLISYPNIDVNKQENSGGTPLMGAYTHSKTYSNIETIKLLLDHPNIDINKHNKKGQTVLMMACRYSNTDFDIETIKLLLNHPNININKQNNVGNTAFSYLRHYVGSEFESKLLRPFMGCPKFDIINLNLCDLGRFVDIFKSCEKDTEEVLIEPILNSGTSVRKSFLKVLIRGNPKCSELLLSRILCPLNFDRECMSLLLKNSHNTEKLIYYCNLHINIKKEIHKNILSHKEEIYCKPYNIIALCSEVDFELKHKNKTQVFQELNKKLKYLFDIKNEDDMIKKTSTALAQ